MSERKARPVNRYNPFIDSWEWVSPDDSASDARGNYGSTAQYLGPGSVLVVDPRPTFSVKPLTMEVEARWYCPYCGSDNKEWRETRRGCQAPRRAE